MADNKSVAAAVSVVEAGATTYTNEQKKTPVGFEPCLPKGFLHYLLEIQQKLSLILWWCCLYDVALSHKLTAFYLARFGLFLILTNDFPFCLSVCCCCCFTPLIWFFFIYVLRIVIVYRPKSRQYNVFSYTNLKVCIFFYFTAVCLQFFSCLTIHSTFLLCFKITTFTTFSGLLLLLSLNCKPMKQNLKEITCRKRKINSSLLFFASFSFQVNLLFIVPLE